MEFNAIFVIPLSDGRLQFFAIDTNFQLWSCWKETTDPNSGWTGLSAFAMPPAGGVISLTGGSLPDKRPQIWAIDEDRNLWSCWKETTDSDSAWTDWTEF